MMGYFLTFMCIVASGIAFVVTVGAIGGTAIVVYCIWHDDMRPVKNFIAKLLS